MATPSSSNPSRPLPWLGDGRHAVDVLTALGYQTVRAGLAHIATNWGTAPFDYQVFNYLIPNDYIWRPLDGEEPPPTPLTIESLLLIPILEPSSRPVPFMTRMDLVSWWEQQLPAAHLNDKSRTDSLTDPAALISAAFLHLRDSLSYVFEDTPALGACLSMIGAGALSIAWAVPCQVCHFRLSVLGTNRCSSCSRSKRVVGAPEDRGAAARAWRARLIRAGVPALQNDSSEDFRAAFSRSIASILFSMRQGCTLHRQWLDSVHSALQASPLVCARIPQDFAEMTHRDQLRALQVHIDNNEWDYAAWPLKVKKAQLWLESAARVKARRRGPGPMPESLAKAKTAMELLRGGMSRGQVAKTLGISPSHLSHLLRRTAPYLEP